MQPTAPVVDYRTPHHGLDQRHLDVPEASKFDLARQQVIGQLNNKVLVGHGLWQSLALLNITHPAVTTRDVAT